MPRPLTPAHIFVCCRLTPRNIRGCIPNATGVFTSHKLLQYVAGLPRDRLQIARYQACPATNARAAARLYDGSLGTDSQRHGFMIARYWTHGQNAANVAAPSAFLSPPLVPPVRQTPREIQP